MGSIYVEEAARVLNRIRYAINDADPEWEKQGTLSQKAIRALRSTAGVSVVLVGMRQGAYVEDVLTDLACKFRMAISFVSYTVQKGSYCPSP